jgi:hypothetical protein
MDHGSWIMDYGSYWIMDRLCVHILLDSSCTNVQCHRGGDAVAGAAALLCSRHTHPQFGTENSCATRPSGHDAGCQFAPTVRLRRRSAHGSRLSRLLSAPQWLTTAMRCAGCCASHCRNASVRSPLAQCASHAPPPPAACPPSHAAPHSAAAAAASAGATAASQHGRPARKVKKLALFC